MLIKKLDFALLPKEWQSEYGLPYREGPPPKRTIKDLVVGECGWVQPWSLFVDHASKFWIHREFPMESRKTGAFIVKVERLDNGYSADISGCKAFRWTPLEAFKIHRGDFVANISQLKTE